MKLSIITINRNNESGLKQTLISVAEQSFKDFEHIIIDGTSTDNSVEVIKSFPHVAYYVSEPDNGIYDAMNKGIKIANGEYCLFLNSGDYLSSNSALEKIFQYNFFEDIVYGNIIMENGFGQRHLRKQHSALSILNFVSRDANYFFINHQSSFIKRILFAQIGFYRTDLSTTSDAIFEVKAIFEYGATYRHIPVSFCVYNTTGMSSYNSKNHLQELNEEVLNFFKYPELYDSINSIAFYDKVWNTPFVKSWYNFYNSMRRLKLKIRIFLGKEKKIAIFNPKKIRIPKNKKILVWGIDTDDILIYRYCNELKIFIYGFLDSSDTKHRHSFLGRPVFAPKLAFENKDRDFFIIIASNSHSENISKTCRDAGLVENKDFVVPFDGLEKHEER